MRLLRERQFHDEQAFRRRASWAAREDSLRFDDDAYLDHEPWIRPAFDALGDVRGLPVLDLGCGHGMAAVVLARRGAVVTGLDLSAGYLAEAETRARVNGVDVRWIQASGENLPFDDGAFARVWGNAILHHLDLDRAAAELHRVLAPGGFAVFCEPWGENPLLNWARRHLPYAGKDRTPDEEPLTSNHLARLAHTFPNLEVRSFQLLGMAARFVGRGRLQRALDWCDQRVLSRSPHLRKFCRYVVVKLQRTGDLTTESQRTQR